MSAGTCGRPSLAGDSALASGSAPASGSFLASGSFPLSLDAGFEKSGGGQERVGVRICI